MQEHLDQINASVDLAKLAPGGAYVGLTMFGVSIPDLVAVLTGIYMIAQIILLIPKYKEAYRAWRQSK